MNKKRICFSLPCYNEVENVQGIAEEIIRICDEQIPEYDITLQFIDNCSSDGTKQVLQSLCDAYNNVRVIYNVRNFGGISGYYGLLETDGDCSIALPTDFQVPLSIIPELVHKWEKGSKIVCAVKPQSKENRIMRFIRQCYYYIVKRLTSVTQVKNFHGTGLYDKEFLDFCRELNDPAPFMPGIVAEFGYAVDYVPYTEQRRRTGKSHNNFYTLFDTAMRNLTTYSKVIPRIATFSGMGIAFVSFVFAFYYLIMKLRYWRTFQAGMAPLVVGMFFFFGVVLVFIGLLGEYLLSINTRLIRRPLVVERTRIGFDSERAER